MFSFPHAKTQRNAKRFCKIYITKKTPQCDVSTKILCYKNISYFNTPPQFLSSSNP